MRWQGGYRLYNKTSACPRFSIPSPPNQPYNSDFYGSPSHIFKMINAFTVLAATALASFACAAPLQPRDVTCVSGLYMIVARGTGEATGEGKPAQVADLVAARVPNSVSVAVDYPATALKKRALYPASVTDGINDTKQKIEDYVAACGDGSRIALIGFSQGGNVMTDLLAGGVLKPAPLSEKYRQNSQSTQMIHYISC